MPHASIVICVYNRGKQVGECLDSILGLSCRDFQLVVVDDHSTDDTPERLNDFCKAHPTIPITVVRSERNLGVSGARNVGIDVATGDCIVFTDSDCTVEPNWLTEMLATLEQPGVAAVAGVVVDHPPRNLAELAYGGTSRIGKRAQGRPLVGNNMGFRTEILRRYRFDSALSYYCDDDDLAWRLTMDGHKIAFVPTGIVHHNHALTLTKLLSMAFRQGQGAARYWYKSGSFLGKDIVLLFMTLLTLPLALIGSFWWLIPLFLALSHGAALIFNQFWFKGKPLHLSLACLPVDFLCYFFKFGGVVLTYGRIIARRETAIRESKRQWWAQPHPPSEGAGS